MGNADYRQNPEITYREALRFKERMDYPGAKTSLTYIASGTAKLSYQNVSTNPNTLITATDENYMYTGGFDLAGREKLHLDDVYSDATIPFWAVKRNKICLGTSRQQEIPYVSKENLFGYRYLLKKGLQVCFLATEVLGSP